MRMPPFWYWEKRPKAPYLEYTIASAILKCWHFNTNGCSITHQCAAIPYPIYQRPQENGGGATNVSSFNLASCFLFLLLNFCLVDLALSYTSTPFSLFLSFLLYFLIPIFSLSFSLFYSPSISPLTYILLISLLFPSSFSNCFSDQFLFTYESLWGPDSLQLKLVLCIEWCDGVSKGSYTNRERHSH